MPHTSTKSRFFLIIASFFFVSSALSAQLIVDWGHDWGGGWYRQPPNKDGNSAWRPLAQLDINENGITQDDRTGGWGFSLTETLSPYNMVYDYTYPSARFYGAAIVQVTDIPEKENGAGYENIQAPTEGHINQNHELRDDWNLMTFPSRKREPELSRYAGAMLSIWKKEDFLSGGSQFPVSFEDDGYIGVFVSRYWGGINWGRWIVMQDSQLYISKDTFAGKTEQFDLTDSQEGDGARNPVVRTTHTINPNDTEWAKYNPAAPAAVYFDAERANFKPMDFNDIEAVGFLAQRNLSTGHPVANGLWDLPYGIGEPIALKFNAVQVRATVNAPKNWSAHAEMVKVSPALLAGKTEVTYAQWIQVVRWAASNQRARNFSEGFEQYEMPGYSFLKDGAMGSMETGDNREYSPQEPVTEISWYDAVLWCNALSEMEGLTPSYYEDADFTTPIRAVFPREFIEERDSRKTVYWKKDANGYRLPTEEEFGTTLKGNLTPSATTAWIRGDAEETTHPVGLKKETNGVYDLLGNVAEYVWDANGTVCKAPKRSHTVLGGSFVYPDKDKTYKPFGEKPFQGSASVGFRVWRNTGVSATAETAEQITGLPLRRIKNDDFVDSEKPMTEDELRQLAEDILDLKPVPASGGLPSNDNIKREYRDTGKYDLNFATVETPYRLWALIRQWAEMTGDYKFNYSGDMGNLRYLTKETINASHTPDEPVTQISWMDAIVWCNALSELFDLNPVYVDKDTGEPIRDASTFRVEDYQRYAYANTGRYHDRPIDTAAVINLKAMAENNGFRLPTLKEFEAAHTKSRSEENGWFLTNSGGLTHPVGTKQPNKNGLYDMDGNVVEMTYGGDNLNGQVRAGNHFADAPGTYLHQMTRKEFPFTGRSYQGFRVVRRP